MPFSREWPLPCPGAISPWIDKIFSCIFQSCVECWYEGTRRVWVPFWRPDYLIRSSKIFSMSWQGRPMSYSRSASPGRVEWNRSKAGTRIGLHVMSYSRSALPGRVEWNRSKAGMRIGLHVILMATYLDYWMYEAARSPIRVRRSHESTRKRHMRNRKSRQTGSRHNIHCENIILYVKFYLGPYLPRYASGFVGNCRCSGRLNQLHGGQERNQRQNHGVLKSWGRNFRRVVQCPG